VKSFCVIHKMNGRLSVGIQVKPSAAGVTQMKQPPTMNFFQA